MEGRREGATLTAPPQPLPMRISLIVAALALALPASAQDAPADDSATVVSVLQQDGRFTVLVDAIERAGLTQTLSEPGPYTVFAPTDSAFAALPEGTLESLTPEDLQGVLLGHVIAGAVSSNQAFEAGEAPGAWGDRVFTFTEIDTGLAVDDVAIVQADVVASNGVIHVIDGVLLPSAPAGDSVDDGDMDDQPDDDGSPDGSF